MLVLRRQRQRMLNQMIRVFGLLETQDGADILPASHLTAAFLRCPISYEIITKNSASKTTTAIADPKIPGRVLSEKYLSPQKAMTDAPTT